MPHAPGRRNEGRKTYECGEKNKVGREEERERRRGVSTERREDRKERGQCIERKVGREEGGERG